MIEQLADLLWTARLAGLPGEIILGCLALYLPAWAVLVWRGTGRGASAAAALVAVLGLGAIGGALAFVSASRAGLRDAAGFGPPSSLAPRVYRAMDAWMAVERGELGLLILAIALLVTAVFGLALVARRALSPAAPGPGALALAAGAFTAAGALVVPLLDRTIRMLPQRARNTVSTGVLGAMIEGSLGAHRASRAALVAGMILAVALAGLLWWHRWRDRVRDAAPRGRGTAVAGAALLAAGIAAMAATRGHAADAASPLPTRDRLPTEWLFDEGDATDEAGWLPDATRCEPLEPDHSGMPAIYRTPIVYVDGPTATFAADTYVDGALLATMLAERHVRVMGPDARDLPMTVILRMGRDVRTADVVRWSRALRGVTKDWMFVDAIRRRSSWPSRTLGEIPGGGWYCSLRLTWGDGDHAMSAYGTFGDVVAEMERSPGARWAP